MEVSEALHYMRGKRALLSNPGLILSDLYYDTTSSSVQDAECTFNTGRFTNSLSQLQFNGQSQITVPISSFLSTIYLRLTLPSVTVPTGQYLALPTGWGYAAITNISYLLGSCNVSQLQISGQSLLQANLAECETAEKRTEIAMLGGAPIVVGPSTTMPAQDAYIVLNFPWSRTSGYLKLPVDTTLMSNSIFLNIQLNQPQYFITGSYASTYYTANPSFTNGQVMLRQGNLRDKALSLRDKLMVNKNLSYNYPFIHYQSFTPPAFTNTLNQLNTVTLQSFINADLTSIIIEVHRLADLTGGASATVPNVANPGLLYEIRDTQLLFNGEVDYNCPGKIYKLYDMNNEEGADYNGYVGIQQAGGGAGTVALTNEIPVYRFRVDYGRRKGLTFDGMYQNVRRIANQVLTLSFYIDEAPWSTNFVGYQSVNGAQFQVTCTYCYNGVASFVDGQSKIYFD